MLSALRKKLSRALSKSESEGLNDSPDEAEAQEDAHKSPELLALEESMSKAQRSLIEQTELIEHLEDQRQATKKDEAKLAVDILTQERRKQLIEITVEDCRQDMEKCQGTQANLIRKKVELQERLEKASSGHQSAIQKHERLKAEATECETTLIEMTTAMAQRMARSRDLKKTVDHKNDLHAKLEANLKKVQQRHKNAKKRVKAVEGELIALNNSKNGRAELHETLTNTLLQLQREVSDLGVQEKKEEKHNSRILDELYHCKNEKQENSKMLEKLKQAIPEMNAHASRLGSMCRDCEEQSISLSSKAAALDSESQEASRILISLDKRIIQLTEQLSSLEKEKTQISQNLSDLKQKVSNIADTIAKHELEMRKLEAGMEVANAYAEKVQGQIDTETHKSRNLQIEEDPKQISCTINCNRVLNEVGTNGTLTITGYLLIFETTASSNKDTTRTASVPKISSEINVCVEISDVLTSIVYTDFEPFQESQEKPIKLKVRLRQGWRNLFLFDANSNSNPRADEETDLIISGDAKKLEEACSSLHQSIILHNRDSEHKQAGAQVENSEAFPNLQGEVSSEDDEDQGQLIQHTGEVNRPKLTGDKDGKQAVNVVGDSNIVTLQQLKKILRSLPRRYNLNKWRLLYSMTRDGVSLRRFYELCEENTSSATVIVIRDATGQVFGAFASQTWRAKSEYYGTGESCVFNFDRKGEFFRYGWSGENEYFQYSTEASLSIGGGSNFAISIDGDLDRGSSGPCSTFDSPRLTKEDVFHCRMFEVWSPSGGDRGGDAVLDF